MSKRIRLHRDTLSSWETVNPVLASGEPGVAYDPVNNLPRLKFGDGVTPWVDLPWFTDTPNPPPFDGGGELARYDANISTVPPDPITLTLPAMPVGRVMLFLNGILESWVPTISGRDVVLPPDAMADIIPGDLITALYSRTAQ